MNDDKHASPLKECGKCKKVAIPEGGVQVGRTRWVCARCFRKLGGM